MIKLIESPLFDPLILLTILANCFTMAWASPLDEPGTVKAHLIEKSDSVFLAIFTCELTLKVISYGLLGHRQTHALGVHAAGGSDAKTACMSLSPDIVLWRGR